MEENTYLKDLDILIQKNKDNRKETYTKLNSKTVEWIEIGGKAPKIGEIFLFLFTDNPFSRCLEKQELMRYMMLRRKSLKYDSL